MRSASVLAIVAAATLSVSSLATAQTSTTTEAVGQATTTVEGTVEGASGSANAGAEGSGEGSTSTTGSGGNSSTSGSASAFVSVDANADGVVSDDELAQFNTAVSASGSAAITVDANGDGTITVEEIAAADAALQAALQQQEGASGADTEGMADDETLTCAEGGLAALLGGFGMVDAAALSAATSFTVVLISGCEDEDLEATLASDNANAVREALTGNQAALDALNQREAGLADVLGASNMDGVIRIYIADRAREELVGGGSAATEAPRGRGRAALSRSVQPPAAHPAMPRHSVA